MKKLNLPLLLATVLVSATVVVLVFLVHSLQVSRNAGSIAEQARQKRAAGDIDAAANLFARYLAFRRGDDETLVEYAEMLLDQAPTRRRSRPFLERTYTVVEEALRRQPTQDGLRLRVAEFELGLGRPTDAREHLLMLRTKIAAGAVADTDSAPSRARSPEPTLADVDTLLARVDLQLRNPELAAERLARVVGYDLARQRFGGGDPAGAGRDAFLLLAATLRERLGRAPAAREVIAELVRVRPEDPAAWLGAGRFHLADGDLEAAAAAIARARALAPRDADTLFTAVDLELARGQFAAAGQLLAEARESFPGDERGITGLADVAIRQNDLPGAEALLTEGVAKLPTRPRLRLLLAEVLLRRGKSDACRAALEEGKKLLGDTNPAIQLLECRLLMAEERWTEARRVLEALRPLVTGTPGLVLQIDTLLAECCAQLGEVDEQLRISKRILLEDPGSVPARVIAAQALAAMGRLDEAGSEFEALAAGIPADRLPALPQVWLPLVQFRMLRASRNPVGQRDWSGVDGILDTVAGSKSATGPLPVLVRAEVLIRKGEPEAAIAVLDRASAESDDPRLLPALATLVLRERGPAAARGVLNRAKAGQPAGSELLIARARVAARESAAAAAEEFAAVEAEAARLPAGERAGVLAELAGLQARLGGTADAARLLGLVARERPGDLRPKTALFDLALAAGDVAGARRAADELTTLTGPQNPWSRLARAGVRILTVREARQPAPDPAGLPSAAEQERVLEDARTLLLEAEADRPDWPPVQTMLAEIALLKGDTSAAIDRLQRAVRSGLANPAVVRQLVALLFAANRFSEVEEAIDSLGRENLEGLERFSAELEIRAGRLDEAVALAERAVARDATDASDLVWLGQILDKSRQPDRAGAAFERAVTLAPERVDAWLALFSHQLATGNRDAAEATLARLADAIPDPRRQVALAQGYELLGRGAEAEAALRRAVAQDPADATFEQTLAAFLVRNGQPEAASEVLTGIIGSTSEQAAARQARTWARRMLAEILGSRGDYPGLRAAIALLDQNRDGRGRLPSEDLALGVGLLARRSEPQSWRLAIERLRTLGETAPLQPSQRIVLAELLERSGRWEEARGELLALAATPNAPPGFLGLLAGKLLDHGEPATARTWITKLRAVLPSAPSTMVLELRLALAEGDRTAATDIVRTLTAEPALAKQDPAQLATVARVLEDADFFAAAETVLERLEAAAPDGILTRAEALGRRHRPAEALDALEGSRSTLPPERVLTSAIAIARAQPDSPETTTRVSRWVEQARAADPDAVVLALLDADYRGLIGDGSGAEGIYRELLARGDLTPTQAGIAANNLAVQLSRPDRAGAALELANQAIDQLGPVPDLLDTRAVVRLMLDDARGALVDMQDAMLQPDDLKYLHFACVRHKGGDRVAAAKALAESRRLGLTDRRLSPLDRELLEALERDLGPAAEAAPTRG